MGTYFASAGGGTYYLFWGGVAVGALQFLRGLMRANGTWRLLGTVAMAAILVVGLVVFQVAPDASDFYNAPMVGDCLDNETFNITDCSKTNALEIVAVKIYSDGMDYPGEDRFDLDTTLCPSSTDSIVFPTRESWKDGDRLLACVMGELEENRPW